MGNNNNKNKTTTKQRSDREIVLDMVMEIMEKGSFSHITIRKYLDVYKDYSKEKRAFITRMAEGTVEKAITLDYVIDCYSKVKTKKMKPVIRNVLRISVYQILFMDNVPDSAACNEAVKITRKRGFSNLSGFVNGVLRNVSRNTDELDIDIMEPGEMNDSADIISVKYSIPKWIVWHFDRNYGRDKTLRILEGMKEKSENSDVTVRINTSKISSEKLCEMLENEGQAYRRTPFAENALILEKCDSISTLKAFKDGVIQVQDISSILVGQISGVKKKDYCIDMCAAPGGKSLHIADLLNGTGFVDSRDVSENKVNLINENIARNGFKNIKAKVWDATQPDEAVRENADVIIADVPCSGLGILAKKTDIKYKLQEKQLEELADLSKKILENAVNYLKPGGTLIFSTCTINPGENTDICKYIENELGLMPVDIRNELPGVLLQDTDYRNMAEKGYLQIFTSCELDGFFISKYRKKV